MKFITLLVVAAACTLGGCASTDNAQKAPVAAGEESYIALGSNIPRKGTRNKGDQNADMQQLENARIQNNGAINGGH